MYIDIDNLDSNQTDNSECNELHIGYTPRSIMTKGTSTRRKNRLPGPLYGNFDPGNDDKLMISYRREPSHDYTMTGACSVLFEGEMHFFGGDLVLDQQYDLSRQHFVIETQRSGQMVKMTKKQDLDIGLYDPSCSSFEMTSDHFPWFKTNVVILCFDGNHTKSCYSFVDKLTFIGDSNIVHLIGRLTKYKSGLLTVGGLDSWWTLEGDLVFVDTLNQKTEILKYDDNKNFGWSIVEQDYIFTEGKGIVGHSLVTVASSDITEEYVLLIGGYNDDYKYLKSIFKFNGIWSLFGTLKKGRWTHNSIYWNNAVYVVGGEYESDNTKTKIEIWNMKDSPYEFQAKENWPNLLGWDNPHLFIVPDSFFPDS